MHANQRWNVIKAHIAKGDKAQDKASQHYKAAGLHLNALKAEHTGTWAEWESLVKEKAGIGKSRASELMQIADGTKTVEGIREATAEKVRQIRARKSSPVRTGENAGDPEASAEIMKAKFAASESPAAISKITKKELEAAQAHIAELETAREQDKDLAEQLHAAGIEIAKLQSEIAELKAEIKTLRAKQKQPFLELQATSH